MSDIDSVFTFGDRLARYRPTIKVVVYSFDKEEPFYLSDDVYACSTSKNIKGVGQLNLSILPRKNYINHLFPNDYINVYFDKGDGKGWVRTFFGMIDKIEETYSVSTDGVPKSFYNVIASDFAKAVDRLSIVFNPYLRNRPELDGSLVGVTRIGGLLMTVAGFKAMGSPPDVVTDLLVLMFGNKSQFLLPSSLNPSLSSELRASRFADLYNRTSPDVRARLADPSAIQDLIEARRTQVESIAQQALAVEPSERAALLARATGLTTTNFTSNVLSTSDPERLQAMILSSMFAQELFPDSSANFQEERARQLFNTLAANTGSLSWLDIVDITTYVERSAIDGYLPTSAIQQDQGSLMSILRSFSNEPVVEMFFDLRPYTNTGGLDGDSYTTEPDETGENVSHPFAEPGVKYLPALVMREYPFSTVDTVTTTSTKFVSVRTPLADNQFYFGAIFSRAPNVAGRQTVKMPAINPLDIQDGFSTRTATKHIDVATLRDVEIKSTKFSRSDTDHLNLFEVSTTGLAQASLPFIVSELVPIVTPSQILRHGVRRRAITSRYGSVAASMAATSTGVRRPRTPDGVLVPTQPTFTAADAPQASLQPSTPVAVPGVSRRDLRGTFLGVRSVWPIRTTRERTGSGFGYRSRPTSANSPPVPPPGASIPTGDRVWRFHNGIDIPGTEATDILAVADGVVIAIVPNITPANRTGFGGYGNTVMIKHKGGAFYTMYAHMSSFSDDLVTAFGMRVGLPETYFSSEFPGRGRSGNSVTVTAGTVLGKMGRTYGPTPVGQGAGVHLHLEVIVPERIPGVIYPSQRKQRTPDFPIVPGSSAPRLDVPYTYTTYASGPASFTPTYYVSVDPMEFFQITRGTGYVPPVSAQETPVDDADQSDEAPTSTLTSSQPTQDSSGTSTTTLSQTRPISTNDSPEIRSQVARWALLQDHWYQHNLEYLSGTIECRPAPEIRVGYRLDLPDRNLSFYVESVSHSWTYGGTMSTVIQVTRGQPSNPYPVYVYPASTELVTDVSKQRSMTGRLMQFFVVPDPLAVRRSYALRAQNPDNKNTNRLVPSLSGSINVTDLIESLGDEVVGHAVTYGSSEDLEEVLALDAATREPAVLESRDRPEVANPAPTPDPLMSFQNESSE